MSQVQSKLTTSIITFSNGRKATLVESPSETTATDIVATLGLANPAAVILILGGDDLQNATLQPHLVQLFSRGIARAVLDNNALIIDGGTASAAISALAQAVVERNSQLFLLGIANDGNVTWPKRTSAVSTADPRNLDSYHTHFVAVQSAGSGGEVAKMCEIARQLSQGVPVLAVLASDSPNIMDEVVRSVRQGWPILVIQDAGGFADDIQKAWQDKQDYLMALSAWKSTDSNPKPISPFISDPALAEIIADGDLHFFSVTDTPENLAQRIDLKLKASNILNQALAQRLVYSEDADRLERTFHWQQNSILVLGVVITALAAIQSVLRQMSNWNVQWSVPLLTQFGMTSLVSVLHLILIIMPVILALLIAGANRFNPGNKWIAMRTASQSFKREIFRYRTRTGNYSDRSVIINKTTREATLAKMLEIISRQWIEGNLEYGIFPAPAQNSKQPQTRSNNAQPSGNQQSQTQPTRQAQLPDSGPLYLPPNRYMIERVENQLDFYKSRSARLARTLTTLQWLILGFGGLATLLAALGGELIITVTTATATALASYLEYQQVVNTLKQYNHAILNLTNIQNWWTALGDAQSDPDNIDKLVEYVESTLQSEQAGWVQQMQAALTELRARQTKQDASGASATDTKGQQGQTTTDGTQDGKQNTANLPPVVVSGPLQADGSAQSNDASSTEGGC